MSKLAVYTIGIFLLLTWENANSLFVCSPNSISPQITASLTLSCQPTIDKPVLAMHIRKKTDNAAIEKELSKQEQQGQVTQNEHDGGEELEQDTPPVTLPEIYAEEDEDDTEEQYSRFAKSRNNRRKRSVGVPFNRATIASREGANVVPFDERFAAEGSVEDSPYLTLTILKPDVYDLGVYECEVSFWSGSGIGTTSEIVQVQAEVKLTVEDLEKRVKKLEDAANVNENLEKEMKRVIGQSSLLNEMVQDKLLTMAQQIEEMLNDVRQMTMQVSILEDDYKDLKAQVDHQQGNSNQPNTQVSNVGNNQKNKFDTNAQEDVMMDLKTRLEHMENIKLMALVTTMKNINQNVMNMQDRVTSLEKIVTIHMADQISKLQNNGVPALAASLQQMEMEQIPMIMQTMTEIRENVSVIQRQCQALVTPAQVSSKGTPLTTLPPPTTTPIPETTPMKFTGPACYVCGRNETYEHCPVAKIKNAQQCPTNQPYCITDIYQDGLERHVYKRCASEKECQIGNSQSSQECDTETFKEIKRMTCHFCCTTSLCNSSIRPPADNYN